MIKFKAVRVPPHASVLASPTPKALPMSLLTRLTVPLEGEVKIPAHQFMALCAEYARGVLNVDKAFIASTFSIADPGELLELDSILSEFINRRISREVIHDALLLGEESIYNTSKVSNRIAQPTGETDLEAITARQVYRIQNAAQTGEFAFRGCNVNAQKPPSLSVSISEGSVLSNGSNVNDVALVSSLSVATPHDTLPRIDLVYVDSSGVVHIREGTPSLSPQAPSVAMTNECALAFLFVGGGTTAIQGKHIQDVTVRRNHGPIRIGSRNNPSTFSNSSSIQQLWGVTVPGLLLKARSVRVVAGGTILANGAPMSIDWRIRFGGVVWRDSTPVLPVSANLIPWRIEFELFGQDDAVQVLSGTFSIGDESSPNNGQGSIDDDETISLSPIRGTSSTDSLVSQSLNFATIMSAADALNQITIDYAQAQLI